MRFAVAAVFVVVVSSCSAPPAPCRSSAECVGVNKCINGTCQDPSGCVPESTAEYCSRLSKSCGAVSAEDNCGNARIE
jgi:hypothetical protein